MSLYEQVSAVTTSNPRNIVWGQVVAVGPPMSVRIARDQTDITVTLWLSSYTPTNGDKVVLLRVGQQWIILGKLTNV